MKRFDGKRVFATIIAVVMVLALVVSLISSAFIYL